MKTKWLISLIVIIFLNGSLYSQAITQDSIAILKQQKESLKISKKLNERKLELAKLENNVEKKTQDVHNTAQQAQASANENGQAATNLTGNAQDEKLAKKASKSADNAKSDAKKARKAVQSLANLQKDIADLRKKIAEDEMKLGAVPVTRVTSLQPAATRTVVDTTHTVYNTTDSINKTHTDSSNKMRTDSTVNKY